MLDERIQKLIEDQKNSNGIDIRRLPIGTRIRVRTRNTVYHMIIRGDREVTVRGGRYFPFPTRTYLPGSTWGGSMLMVGWIGHSMNIELHHPLTDKIVTTTSVQEAEVIGQNWKYQMDWQVDEP